MTTEYETRYAIGQQEAKGYDTQALRDAFLADKLMQPGKIYWVYSHYERFMVGGAVPLATGLTLDTLDALKSRPFTPAPEGTTAAPAPSRWAFSPDQQRMRPGSC